MIMPAEDRPGMTVLKHRNFALLWSGQTMRLMQNPGNNWR
jgi:hypothetical protein